MSAIEDNKKATQKVIDTWNGESIEYKGIKYSIEYCITDSNDDLFKDNPKIDDIDFNISVLFKALGFYSMIYGYGFKHIN